MGAAATSIFNCDSADVSSGDVSGADDIAVCDFQFAGGGLGAADLMYLLYPGTEHMCLLHSYFETIRIILL
jgi:hypothetical protein